MRLRLMILLVVIFFLTGEVDEDFTTYRSLVDTYSGFYSVINNKTEEHSQYENYTLNVNIGDKIIWVNRDTDAITIISDQGLWRNNTVILAYRKQFNYTFDNPGIYTFYIDRYKKLSKQTIIVSGGNTNNTINMTIEPTPTTTTIDASNNSATYRSTVNGLYGFYKLIDNTGKSISYENYTININVGDKIIWVSDDSSDKINIISEQKLWKSKSSMLEYTGKEFNHTFKRPGIYTFNIEQRQDLPRQTIIVSSIRDSDFIDDIIVTEDDNISVNSTNPIILSNVSNDNMQISSFLIPLDIFSNIKLTSIISFVMIIIMSFVKDIIRKNGENI